MLSLDDPRWKSLNHRGWIDGARWEKDPGAPFVPEELARLIENPTDLGRFNSLWPYLCSEGTAYPAAYAAIPHIVELARRLPPSQRLDHLWFLGLVERSTARTAEGLRKVEPFLVEEYRRALGDAFPLLCEALAGPHTPRDTRYLLATAATLMGHPRLGEILDDLESISQECPGCSEFVYPEELQGIDDEVEVEAND